MRMPGRVVGLTCLGLLGASVLMVFSHWQIEFPVKAERVRSESFLSVTSPPPVAFGTKPHLRCPNITSSCGQLSTLRQIEKRSILCGPNFKVMGSQLQPYYAVQLQAYASTHSSTKSKVKYLGTTAG